MGTPTFYQGVGKPTLLSEKEQRNLGVEPHHLSTFANLATMAALTFHRSAEVAAWEAGPIVIPFK